MGTSVNALNLGKGQGTPLLAECYRRWIAEHGSWRPLAEFISKASIDHGKEHGLLVDAGLVNLDGKSLFSRRQEMARAADYIVEAAAEARDAAS